MLARGGFLPVITPTLMGVGFILVGWFVNPLYGLAPGLGVLMLMLAAFFANFWRDPDRPIPRDEGVIVSPAGSFAASSWRRRQAAAAAAHCLGVVCPCQKAHKAQQRKPGAGRGRHQRQRQRLQRAALAPESLTPHLC